jgi:CCR4-NOT transcription complex subunit 3
MAARKLQQEIDKCFKKVAEGVATFESIYEMSEIKDKKPLLDHRKLIETVR